MAIGPVRSSKVATWVAKVAPFGLIIIAADQGHGIEAQNDKHNSTENNNKRRRDVCHPEPCQKKGTDLKFQR